MQQYGCRSGILLWAAAWYRALCRGKFWTSFDRRIPFLYGTRMEKGWTDLYFSCFYDPGYPHFYRNLWRFKRRFPFYGKIHSNRCLWWLRPFGTAMRCLGAAHRILSFGKTFCRCNASVRCPSGNDRPMEENAWAKKSVWKTNRRIGLYPAPRRSGK